MNMKAKKRVICACEGEGFEKYNVMITVPKGHPFGKKGFGDLDVNVAWAIFDNVWKISFSRESFEDALDDADVVIKYLDDMLDTAKIVDMHDLLDATVEGVDRLEDDAWKITLKLSDGTMAEMFGDVWR